LWGGGRGWGGEKGGGGGGGDLCSVGRGTIILRILNCFFSILLILQFTRSILYRDILAIQTFSRGRPYRILSFSDLILKYGEKDKGEESTE